MKYILILLFPPIFLVAQPNTEVYLFDLVKSGGNYSIDNPVNVSNNPGYDNQPSFLKDSEGLLYTSTRNGQTDIVLYNIGDGTKKWITDSNGSEYSPTQTPDGNSISTIVLEESGRQLLWQYPVGGGSGEILIPFLKIGYHVWLNENLLYAFVLGPQSTFQKIDVETQRAEIILENVGRSLHKVPGNDVISFVDKNLEAWGIKTIDVTDSIQSVVQTPEGSEDMAWINDGSILIGSDSKVLRWAGGNDETWTEIADLSTYEMNGITRIAVSSDQSKVAIVVNE